MSDSDLGLKCPRCHCRHVPAEGGHQVYYTRQGEECIRRVRVCRHCHTRFGTTERVTGSSIGTVPPESD